MRHRWVVAAFATTVLAVPSLTLLTFAAPATAATLPTCSHSLAGDSCSVTAYTAGSMTETVTSVPVTPACTPSAAAQCTYSQFGSFALALNSGSAPLTGDCPASNNSPTTFTSASRDIYDFSAQSITCTITWTWDSATSFPSNSAINLTEQNGEGNLNSPVVFHTFGVTLPPPGPHAAFTYADGADPGDVTFTDKSYSLVPQVTITGEQWSSSDGGSGSGPTWDHTFEKNGTYDVTLEVTDSNNNTDETSEQVKVTSANGSSGSLIVKEHLDPAHDSGRFNLLVDASVVKKKAKNGEQGVAHVAAGAHVVWQTAATVGLTHYAITTSCTRNGKHDVSAKAYGVVVKVNSGDAVTCTFTDRRTSSQHCDVPLLAGSTLARAKADLKAAHCRVGTISKPHSNKKLVVGHSSPAVFAVRAASTKVKLVLVVAH